MLAVVRLMVALDTKAALPALADLKEVTLREATGALIMAEAATEAIAIKWGYVPKRKGLMKLERIKEWSCREQGSRLYALPVPYHGPCTMLGTRHHELSMHFVVGLFVVELCQCISI